MSGTTTYYDSDGSATVSSVLGQVTTAVVEPDGSTPTGELPTVSLTVDLSLVGTVDVLAANGGVADVTNVTGILGALNVAADGGTVNLDPATIGLLSGTAIDIENGGTVTASGTFLGVLDASAINFGPGGGALYFNTDGTLVNLDIVAPITGFAAGDAIVDEDLPLASVASYSLSNPLLSSNQLVTFYSGTNGSGTNLGSLTFAPGTFSGTNGTYNSGSGPLQLAAGPGGAIELAVCFLRGTHIATEHGARRVEALAIGDRVATLQDGETIFKPVTWIGSRTMIASKMAADDAFPVRIRAGAFADGMPLRDLLVTPEHCLLVAGKLVPARMLVNGGSIRFDRTIQAYVYYHVELAEHSVLLAEGLPAESYLDTGNRGNFANAPVPALQPDFAVHASHRAWHDRAAAPLAVNRAFVEPIWQALAARAVSIGMPPAPVERAFTEDPDLRLITDSGLEIRPVLAQADFYSFLVPGGTNTLRMRSRTARPSDIRGPYIDDRRALGVRVGRVDLGIGGKRQAVDAHLSDPALPGWHAPEPGSAGRWTGGNAMLPLDLAACKGRPVFLDIQILQAGPYAAPPAAVPPIATAV